MIPFTNSPGGLFRKTGIITKVINSFNQFRSNADLSAASIVSIGVGADLVAAQYPTASSGEDLIGTLYNNRDAARQAMSSFPANLASLAASTMIRMADFDVALSQGSLDEAMGRVVSQMTSSGDTVKANTTSAAVATAGSNTGTAVVIASVRGTSGKPREYVIAESVVLTCATDSQSQTAQAGQEQWNLTTPLAQNDQLNWDWPKGSGSSTTIIACSVDGSAQMLVNGGFETWTISTFPDNWTLLVGTSGTNVKATSTGFSGSGLEFVGDGSTLLSVKQYFNSASGTSRALLPNTVYGLNMWGRVSSNGTSGVLAVSLVDGSNTVINDDMGNANTISTTITTLTTSYAAINGFFVTPRVLPTSTLGLRCSLTTAMTSGRSLYFDNVTFVQPTEMYVGGPWVAVFPGATNSIIADNFTVTIANDWGGLHQKSFQRLFDMRSLGYQLPSTSGTPTIAENLVT